MAFCNVSDREKEILQVTHLDHMWPVCSSRVEALEAVGGSCPPKEAAMADEQAANLADLISLLWRHGQRTARGRSTAEAASQETPQLLAGNFQELWLEQNFRMDRRLPGPSPNDQGTQEG